ncbi:MAG: hypothetical protein IPN76_23620 [Saprospiraceae bacterium]|nr:hypothetical protein [Saprospiraceae bacterium]
MSKKENMQALDASNREGIGYKEMVKNLDNLDTNSLEKLAGKIGKVVALRKQPTKSEREAQLVKFIKQKIPSSLLKYKNELYEKMEDNTITEKEMEDLHTVVNYLEELNAERIVLIGELAKLRNTDVKVVAAEFIKPKL